MSEYFKLNGQDLDRYITGNWGEDQFKGEQETMSEFFDIDLNRLDWEWARQPALYHKHAADATDKRAEHSRAKAALELTEAEIDLEVRRDPASFGIDKVTESVVRSCIVTSQRYQKALTRVIHAKHDLDVADDSCSVLDHKKYGLQDAVRLRMNDYYSEPRVKDHEGGEKMREASAKNAFNRKGKNK